MRTEKARKVAPVYGGSGRLAAYERNDRIRVFGDQKKSAVGRGARKDPSDDHLHRIFGLCQHDRLANLRNL